MRSIALLLVSSVVGVEGDAVLCPSANHCLKRIAQGSSEKSFSCINPASAGYVCGFENDPRGCTCAGKVKFGNFATWSAEVDVAVNITCSNDNFNGQPGGAKLCWCTPTGAVAGSGNSEAASCDPAGGGAVPKCVITEVQTFVPNTPSATVAGMGYDKTGAGTLAGGVFDTYLSTTHTTILSFNADLESQMQVMCPGTDGQPDSATCMANIDAARGDASLLKANVVQFIGDYEAHLGGMAAFKTMADLRFVNPLSGSMPAAPDGAPAACTYPKLTSGATFGFVKTSGAVILTMIAAAMAAWH